MSGYSPEKQCKYQAAKKRTSQESSPCHIAGCTMHALTVGIQILQHITNVSRQIRGQALLAVPWYIHRILPRVQIHKGLRPCCLCNELHNASLRLAEGFWAPILITALLSLSSMGAIILFARPLEGPGDNLNKCQRQIENHVGVTHLCPGIFPVPVQVHTRSGLPQAQVSTLHSLPSLDVLYRNDLQQARPKSCRPLYCKVESGGGLIGEV